MELEKAKALKNGDKLPQGTVILVDHTVYPANGYHPDCIQVYVAFPEKQDGRSGQWFWSHHL